MPGLACPICRRATERSRDAAFPFCSDRCRLVDLGRWLGEEYRVPAEPDDGDGRGLDAGTGDSAGEGR
jgi:uncharacterized protein